MKWSIVGLLSLGTIAAISAVMFVLAFQNTAQAEGGAGTTPPPSVEAQVLIASRDLPAMSVVRADMLVARTLHEELVPKGALVDPVQVVGKLLVAPMSSGQAFTAGCFATDGSGTSLASALTPGMRAVSVSVVESMAMGNLIYPGSMVDVIAALSVQTGMGQREPVSITLLRGVMVMAIGDRTITDPDKPQNASTVPNRRVTVTLLVDPNQAEQLKLVSEEGTISLALRNPMDETVSETSGARLSQMSPIFADLDSSDRASDLSDELDAAHARLRKMERDQLTALETQRLAIERARLEASAPGKTESSRWETTILRGGVAETKSFPDSEPEAREN